jgi:CRP-like cAMP-binding protein
LSYLHRQGDVPSIVYMLVDGMVKMVHVTPNGDECYIDIRHAPALLGSPFVVTQSPSTLSAITLTTCSLRWCSAESFANALAKTPAGDVHLLHCAEIVSLTERIATMSLKSSRQRLSLALAKYASPGCVPPNAIRGLPIKLRELASLINVTPEHLSRLVHNWRNSKPRAVGDDAQSS